MDGWIIFYLTLRQMCVLRRSPSCTYLAFGCQNQLEPPEQTETKRERVAVFTFNAGRYSAGKLMQINAQILSCFKCAKSLARACSGIKGSEWKCLSKDIPAARRKGKIERKKERKKNPGGLSSPLTNLLV